MNNFFNSLFLPWLDLLALAWFAAWWAGYVWFTDHRETAQPTLRRQMDKYIREWIVQMVGRDNRMLDVNIMRNLTRSSQFFASTTMLILGALVAMMGYAEKAAGVIAELPFSQQVSDREWELKIFLLVVIFVFAFFKLSWSIRQFGLASVLIGATRKPIADAEQYADHIERIYNHTHAPIFDCALVNTAPFSPETLARYAAAAAGARLILGGRLGTYRYLNMDETVASALDTYEREIKNAA